MKIAVEDLEKTLKWVKANSMDVFLGLELDHSGRNIVLKCQDKYQSHVEITLFSESNMKPKIRKEDILP